MQGTDVKQLYHAVTLWTEIKETGNIAIKRETVTQLRVTFPHRFSVLGQPLFQLEGQLMKPVLHLYRRH